MPRTSKQVLDEQKQQTERDRTQRSQQLATRSAPALPTTPDPRSPRQRYLDEVAPSGIVGRLVKFDGKEGKFIFVDTDETISDNEDFIALADQTLAAWIKFEPDQAPTRIGGLLYSPDFELPSRDELGDTDRARWAIGKFSGGPDDPWKEEMMLVLKRPATMELLTFSTLSKTGRRAVGTLLKHYDRLQVSSPGSFPVVRLKVGGYQDSRFGWVHVPNFVVVGASPGHTAAIPNTSLTHEMSDSIPF